MRRRTVITLGVVVLVIAAVVAGVVLHRRAAPAVPHDPVADTNFTVNGQLFNCGTSGRVRPEAELFYPGPNPTILLDDEPVDAMHPGGDQYEYIPTVPLPDFSCADGETHTVRIENDLPKNAIDTGCQIRINPAVQLRAGYNSPDFPSYNAGERDCEVTWTD